ncbi:hypothetical protein PanWU01x14_148730 [Parasponia andersonii]|uniref:Uncharacterized protein n=1 Tax=Parasponia andersonii TaxID=3476 RepID=A0A2P5CJ64_PARAD|nr:hypothetical protein PanWU01x14_148730 [Parasponia andersonii]
MPRSFVEIQGVTQGVVLEFPVPVSATASASVPVQPANESLPPGSGDDLRPLPELLESSNPPGPPVVAMDGPDPLPPDQSDGGGSARPTTGETEAGAARVGQERVGSSFSVRFRIAPGHLIRVVLRHG